MTEHQILVLNSAKYGPARYTLGSQRRSVAHLPTGLSKGEQERIKCFDWTQLDGNTGKPLT